MDNWRNRLAHRLANFILNTVATQDYRDTIDRVMRVGMRTIEKAKEKERYYGE